MKRRDFLKGTGLGAASVAMSREAFARYLCVRVRKLLGRMVRTRDPLPRREASYSCLDRA